MSIISLTMTPLMAGNGDWPATWYIGLIPIVLLIVGTYLVYFFFWKNADLISVDGLREMAVASDSLLRETRVAKCPLAGYDVDPIVEEAPV